MPHHGDQWRVSTLISRFETPHLEPEVLHIILPQADIQGQQLALKEMKIVGIVPPQEDNGSICELSRTPTMCSMPCSLQKTLHNSSTTPADPLQR